MRQERALSPPLCTQHQAQGQAPSRGCRGCCLGGGGEGVTDPRGKPEPESHLPTLILDQDEDPGTPKPVSFTVKETVCPRPTRRPPELCDFKENVVRLGAGGAGGCFPRS